MDIARSDAHKKRRRKRIVLTGIMCLTALLIMGYGLGPSRNIARSVTSSDLIIGTVESGDMVREVRGIGTLVPRHVLVVPADVPGRIAEIYVKPGMEVEPDTMLIRLTNPTLLQEEFELEWQIKAAEAKLSESKALAQRLQLEQEALVEKLKSELSVAELEAAADVELGRDGLVPELAMKKTAAQAKSLASQLAFQERNLSTLIRSGNAQTLVQESETGQINAMLARKRDEIGKLTVKAGTEGVVQQVGSEAEKILQPGESVLTGDVLAKIVDPSNLMAQLKISETQARDVRPGLATRLDTRNGIVAGKVVRVDPAVVNGTVVVDVDITEELPQGSRPDLSVDGTIELEVIENTLFIPRPVTASTEGRRSLFILTADGREAHSVDVELGKVSANYAQVLSGLTSGDRIILSDMRRFQGVDRLRIKN